MIVTNTSSLLYTYFATKRASLKPMWPLVLPRSCLLSGNEELWTKRTSPSPLIYIQEIKPHGQSYRVQNANILPTARYISYL